MKSVVTVLSILILTFGISASEVTSVNQALSLDGYGDYVRIEYAPSLDIEGQITLEA